MADDDATNDRKPRRNILVTGGCGYIGSHTIVLLLQNNYDVTVVDNLSNSSSVSLDRVGDIVGLSAQERKERIVFYEVDICDESAFRAVFEKSPQFHSCIHFAGLKVSRHCKEVDSFDWHVLLTRPTIIPHQTGRRRKYAHPIAIL